MPFPFDPDTSSPLRPDPTPLFLVNSICVIAASLLMAGVTAVEFSYPKNPFACMGALCVTPAFAVIGVSQFLATFRHRPGAAGVVAVLSSCVAAMAAVGVLENLWQLIVTPRRAASDKFFAAIVASVIFAVVALYAAWTARLNRRWADRLRQPLPPNTCVYCGYDLRATPDRCPECGR